MANKEIKYWSDLFQQEITMTVDERLNEVDVNKIAPEKQDAINRQLEEIKDFLPKH
jgi:hypothetical protein